MRCNSLIKEHSLLNGLLFEEVMNISISLKKEGHKYMSNFMISSQMYITNLKYSMFNSNKQTQYLLLFDILKREKLFNDSIEKEVKYGIFVPMKRMIERFFLLLM